MTHHTPDTAERERMLDALRTTADPASGKPLPKMQFFAVAQVSQHRFEKLFASYQAAVEAAGLTPRRFTDVLTLDELLTAYGAAVRAAGVPLRQYQFAAGKCHGGAIRRLCGTYRALPRIFADWAQDKPEWADVAALLGYGSAPPPPRYGLPEPLEFKWMRHVPTNELGVVLLFGQLCPQLGFAVETAQSQFPDCVALQLLSSGIWRRVRIEFEFESRNFAQHRHEPSGCDLIVCWRHNWPDCPGHIEVLELQSQLPAQALLRGSPTHHGSVA